MSATLGKIRDTAVEAILDPNGNEDTYHTTLQIILNMTEEIIQKNNDAVVRHKIKKCGSEAAYREAEREKARRYYQENRERILQRANELYRKKKAAVAAGGASST